MNARWSAGIVFGLPIACSAVLLVAALTAYCWHRSPHNPNYDTLDDGWKLTYRIGFGVLALMLLGLPWAFFPWSAQYQRYVPKSGVVSVIGNRFTDGQASTDTSGTVYGDFVVEFHGSGTRYDCTDTRCALVRPGDTLTLSCIRAFQWTGVPGWDCNYVRDEAAS